MESMACRAWRSMLARAVMAALDWYLTQERRWMPAPPQSAHGANSTVPDLVPKQGFGSRPSDRRRRSVLRCSISFNTLLQMKSWEKVGRGGEVVEGLAAMPSGSCAIAV